MLRAIQNCSFCSRSSCQHNDQKMPHFDSKKSQKECNRWFKRQLVKWTTADLLNIVVTWSKDDDQLIHPNYSDMPPRCRRQRVHSRFCRCANFWTQATVEWLSSSGSFKQASMWEWGTTSGGWKGWKAGHEFLLAFIPSPEALCSVLALQQCWSHLWVLSAEAT